MRSVVAPASARASAVSTVAWVQAQLPYTPWQQPVCEIALVDAHYGLTGFPFASTATDTFLPPFVWTVPS